MNMNTVELINRAFRASQVAPQEHFDRMVRLGLINKNGQLTRLYGGQAEPEPGVEENLQSTQNEFRLKDMCRAVDVLLELLKERLQERDSVPAGISPDEERIPLMPEARRTMLDLLASLGLMQYDPQRDFYSVSWVQYSNIADSQKSRR